jgi:RimJ/RimL family protein N-acetyltransferase
VTEADLPIFFEHQQDPAAFEMAAFTPRDWDAFTTHWAKILNDESLSKQTILFEGRVVGNVVCFERLGEREVGYWIGREYWGKGIATAALRQFLGQFRVRPLVARVAKHNIASQRVLHKCGFDTIGEEKGPPNAHGEVIEDLIMRLAGDDARDETAR